MRYLMAALMLASGLLLTHALVSPQARDRSSWLWTYLPRVSLSRSRAERRSFGVGSRQSRRTVPRARWRGAGFPWPAAGAWAALLDAPAVGPDLLWCDDPRVPSA